MTSLEWLDAQDVPAPYIEEVNGKPELFAGRLELFDAGGNFEGSILRHGSCYELTRNGVTLVVPRT